MHTYSLNFLYIALGILALVLLLANLYWGTFLLLLTQPLFISVASEHAGFGVTKVIYGVLFAIWFVAWALKPVARDTTRPQLRSSMRLPALAFGAVLGVAILMGLLYGAPLDYIVRDLSQYVGYLAVLPLLDLVRTRKQAKRLIFFLALVGLPCSLLYDVAAIGLKQEGILSPTLMALQYGAPYWGPIQGALWAVAVSFPGLAVKLLAWLWLILKSSLSVFSGFRYMLLMFIISALTAFMVSGRIARHSLARYMIPLFLALMVGGVLADLSGMVNLPLTDVTRERYSTLLSEKGLARDQSVEGRFMESRGLFGAFLQNPVTGVGLGYTLKFIWFGRAVEGKGNFRYHNGYLETLMKFGVLGTLIFAWYFFTLFRQAFEVVRTSDNYFAKVIGLGLVIYLVPALAASLAGSFFSEKGFSLTVGVMAGLLPALTFQAEEARVPQPEPAVLNTGKLGQQV